jgi:hypothetical protein
MATKKKKSEKLRAGKNRKEMPRGARPHCHVAFGDWPPLYIYIYYTIDYILYIILLYLGTKTGISAKENNNKNERQNKKTNKWPQKKRRKFEGGEKQNGNATWRTAAPRGLRRLARSLYILYIYIIYYYIIYYILLYYILYIIILYLYIAKPDYMKPV